MGSYTTGCFFRRIVPVSGDTQETNTVVAPGQQNPHTPPVPLSCHQYERHKQQIHQHYFARALCSLQHDIHDVRSQVQSNASALAGASNWDFASNAAVYNYISLEGYALKQRLTANGLAPKGGPAANAAAKGRIPQLSAMTPPPALLLPLGDFHLQSNHTAPLYPTKYANDSVLGGSTLRLVRTTTVPNQEDVMDMRRTDFKHSF